MNEWVIINNAFSLFSLNHVHVLFSVYQSSVFMSHLVLCLPVHPCSCPVFLGVVSSCISMFMSCVMLLLCCVCLHINVHVHVFVWCFCGGVSTRGIIPFSCPVWCFYGVVGICLPLLMSCVVSLWCYVHLYIMFLSCLLFFGVVSTCISCFCLEWFLWCCVYLSIHMEVVLHVGKISQ